MVDDDSRAKKQEMSRLGANSDFISNLPDNIIDRILVRLPLRDAVRTSVLSTNWRYKWTTITQLVIHDNNLIPPSPHNNNNNSKDNKIINFIDRVLLLHSGFIHKFELSIKCLPMISSSMIDAWILFLSRKNIEECVLKFPYWDDDQKYKLPSCFFSAQQIRTLELRRCLLKKPPPTFTGFNNLKSLYFVDITFVDKGGFECLMSKCPLLERLTWKVFDSSVDHLNICSPNLKYLCLNGCFQDICFENTPLLSDVSIRTAYVYLSDEELNKFLQSETGNVVKVLSSLPNLEKFDVGGSFLQFLSLSKIPEKLPFTCHHLKNLSLSQLNFEDVNEICVILCLLNSSPNLRQLEIQLWNQVIKPGHHIENFWEERTHIDWKMSRLQVVKITNFSGIGLKYGLEFIKLLLANSPMLEMLSIKKSPMLEMLLDEKDMLLLLLRLLGFKRASPKAVIEFPDFVKRSTEFPDFV